MSRLVDGVVNMVKMGKNGRFLVFAVGAAVHVGNGAFPCPSPLPRFPPLLCGGCWRLNLYASLVLGLVGGGGAATSSSVPKKGGGFVCIGPFFVVHPFALLCAVLHARSFM